MTRPRVGIIGTNGLPGRYGGWDQLVHHLTSLLRDRFRFVVYGSRFDADPGVKECNGARLVHVPLHANGVQSIPYDLVSSLHAVLACDVLFLCGTSGCVFLPFIRLFGKGIVVNPDGLEWMRGKWSAPVQRFLKLSERFAVRYADVVVADNVRIADHVREAYGKESVLIEYGGDHVMKGVVLSDETARRYGIRAGGYAFKVCRIEPENNVHTILEAFRGAPMDLVVVGNWAHGAYGRELRERYRDCPNVKLLDPIYAQGTLDELRSNCALYVHGHSVGGTNPSLVEAMSLGLPVVAWRVGFNEETTENAALFFGSSAELRATVEAVVRGEIDTRAVGRRMEEIAARRYTWRSVAERYARVFEACAGGNGSA